MPGQEANEAGLNARINAVGELLTEAIEAEGRRPWGTRPPPFADTACGKVVDAADDAGQRAAALWALRYWLKLERHGGPYPAPDGVTALLTNLARRALNWTGEEALASLEWTQQVGYAQPAAYDRMRIPLHAIQAAWPTLTERQREQARLRLIALRDEVSSTQYQPAARNRVMKHLAPLIGIEGDSDKRLSRLLATDDQLWAQLDPDWRRTALTEAGLALLTHCAALTAATPSAAWMRRGQELVAAVRDADDFLRAVLVAVPRVKDQVISHDLGIRIIEEWGWIGDQSVDTVRGVLALAGTLPGDDIPGHLADTAVAAAAGDHYGSTRAPRIANTAIAALARIETVEAVRALARVQARVKNLSILKGVTKALDAAALRTGASRDELLEQSAPDLGLTGVGLLERQIGEHTATLSIALDGVTLSIRDAGGKALRGVPAAVRDGHPEALAELRTLAAEAKKALKPERTRIENLLASGRSWDGPTWARLYLDHPLTGIIARALLWQVTHDDLSAADATWTAGWADAAGDLRSLDGADLTARQATGVRLWHPCVVATDEVRRWRDHLAGAELRQPFKQAYREVYLVTPAEVTTGQYSNRFAAHVVRYPQFAGLLRTRGWSGVSLAHWEGEPAFAHKEFAGYRAEFFYDPAESDLPPGWDEAPALAVTDQVRFYQRQGGEWTLVRIDAVPPLVFSEAMRDADLFVGVTSIARDPFWVDRGDDRYGAYWRDVAFGELSESASDRREALGRLMPQTSIAGRVTVTDRFLVVRGDLRTYKIHLGSGNILMEPNDAYLCIVVARGASAGKAAPKLYLPFEEDGGLLSEIVSKAFLLAADASITDETILTQLRA